MPCPAMELGAVGPFVAMFRFESKGETFVAARCVDGACLLVGRSGTACRAPTVGNSKGEEKNDVVLRAKHQQLQARSCVGTGVVFMTA